MFGQKEERLSKDEIFKLKQAALQLDGFKREIDSIRDLVNSIDRRTNPAAMVDPERARNEVVEKIASMLLADKEKLTEEIKETTIRKLTDDVEIDTSSIEESLAESETFVKEAVKLLDINTIKDNIISEVANKLIEDHLDTDNIAEQVSEVVSQRLEINLRKEE